MHRISNRLVVPLVAAVIGCGAPAVDVSRPARPALRATSVDDGSSVRPTDTITMEFTREVDASTIGETTIVLARGAVDGDLRGKIERAAIPDDQRDAIVPLRL